MWIERHRDTWRIRDRVAGAKITLADGFQTKASAREARDLLRAEALRGDALVPRGDHITLGEYVETWWPAYEASAKPSTAVAARGLLDRHILPALGQLALGDIDAAVVQTWASHISAGIGPWGGCERYRRKPLSPKTVRNAHGLLHTVMRDAVRERRIRINPCAGTRLPRREPAEMRYLTDPEIVRLLTAVPEHWRPLVLLLVGTGLRWGEAIGLRVGRVDLLARRPYLQVVEQLQEPYGGAPLIVVSPKTPRSRRTVTITRQLAQWLAPLVAGRGPRELLFTDERGQPVRTRAFGRRWVRWCREAGLDGLRIHDLRHTHAAILISAGQPLAAISRRLGHSSVHVTDQLYGHLREEVHDGILDAVDSALVGVPGSSDATRDEDQAGGTWGALRPEIPGASRG